MNDNDIKKIHNMIEDLMDKIDSYAYSCDGAYNIQFNDLGIKALDILEFIQSKFKITGYEHRYKG